MSMSNSNETLEISQSKGHGGWMTRDSPEDKTAVEGAKRQHKSENVLRLPDCLYPSSRTLLLQVVKH